LIAILNAWRGGEPHFKLSIQSVRRGGGTDNASWYYFRGGHLGLLAVMRAVWVAPLDRAPTPDAFETLLRTVPPASTQDQN
jgi:hypothetical protein